MPDVYPHPNVAFECKHRPDFATDRRSAWFNSSLIDCFRARSQPSMCHGKHQSRVRVATKMCTDRDRRLAAQHALLNVLAGFHFASDGDGARGNNVLPINPNYTVWTGQVPKPPFASGLAVSDAKQRAIMLACW